MRINYLILAHNQPGLLNRMIGALDGKDVNFFIHIDADAEYNVFTDMFPEKKNIFFLKGNERLSIRWAGFNMVQATLNLMKLSVKIQPEGFCVLLSGNDYPIKSNRYINDFFEKNGDSIFIEGFGLPSKDNWGKSGGMDRLLMYHFILNKKGDKKSIESVYSKDFWKRSKFWDLFDLLKAGNFLALLRLLKKRKFPSYLKPYGGSQWWSMPMKNAIKILDFLDAHPDYVNYHQYTLSPDEIFFHSLTFSLFPDQVTNRSTTWVNWVRPVVRPPVVFNSLDDLEELLGCGRLFARKFDETSSAELLDKIDSMRDSDTWFRGS